MNDILLEFQEYLVGYKKKLAANTLIAYKADIKEFLIFISKKNKTILDIKSKDFFDFFDLLQKRKLSISSGARKSSSLRLFAFYLHEKHEINDYTEFVYLTFSSLPIICTSKQAFKAIQLYSKRGLNSYNELRNFVILYLLYVTKIGVNKLVQLNLDDINYNLRTIKLNHTKNLKIPISFFKTLKDYINKIPYKSNYLFPVKLGSSVKPISKQAVWSLLRSLFKQQKEPVINLNRDQVSAEGNSKIFEIYKTNHPRS